MRFNIFLIAIVILNIVPLIINKFVEIKFIEYIHITQNIIVIAVCLFVGFEIKRNVISPLKKLEEEALKWGTGDLRSEFDMKKINIDEVKSLIKSFTSMKDNLASMIKKIQETSNLLNNSSSESLTSIIESSKVSTEIASHSEVVANSVITQIESVTESSESIQNVILNASSILKSMNYLKEVNDLMNEKVNESNASLKSVVSKIKEVEHGVTDTTETTKRLQEKSSQIESIIDAITEIANKTNLLALNAAIEAARAGEHGKGFNVVADEIKKLAEQSKKSAGDVVNLVREIQMETNVTLDKNNRNKNDVVESVTSINNVTETFKELFEMFIMNNKSVKIMDEKSEVLFKNIKDVSYLIEKIKNASNEINQNAQSTATASEEQASSMEDMRENVKMLSKISDELNNMAESFKV
jgi:methyl-accepting chemotaxis protein